METNFVINIISFYCLNIFSVFFFTQTQWRHFKMCSLEAETPTGRSGAPGADRLWAAAVAGARRLFSGQTIAQQPLTSCGALRLPSCCCKAQRAESSVMCAGRLWILQKRGCLNMYEMLKYKRKQEKRNEDFWRCLFELHRLLVSRWFYYEWNLPEFKHY